MQRRRSGNILVLVALFGILIFLAIVSLGFLTKTDASTTTNLLRELQATYLAESIAAQVDVQTNSRPWNERFWLTPGGAATANLDSTSTILNLSGESMPSSEWSFIGVVKDLPDQLRQYRLYLEVTVRGETYAFSWDKRHEQTLLSGLSHDATEVDKVMDMDSPATSTDTLLDGIKDVEKKAPLTDGSGSNQQTRIGKLRKDRPSHRARSRLPGSKGAPSDPQVKVGEVGSQAATLPVKEDKGSGGDGGGGGRGGGGGGGGNTR